MKNLFYWTLPFCLILACKKEAKLITADLQGNWKLTEAFRNDKKTQTLTGAFYRFSDTMVTTNIFSGEEITTSYKIENMDVIQRVPMEIRYTVSKNPDLSLNFLTMIDGVPFKFTLKKE